VEIPGGSVNEGEDPLEAGLRELLEETGYAGENCRIIGKVCPNPAIQNNSCYTVLVENARRVAEPAQDDMEDIEVLTLPQDAVHKLVADGTISHGLVLNALMFFAMDKGDFGRSETPGRTPDDRPQPGKLIDSVRVSR
jgi:8-oxo-dGTP pyrophosphatase MutT (NUDIX family)